MNMFSLIAEALNSLGKNKVRTGLSMLGIVIGVGSVIVLVAMAEATKRRVADEIAKMGDDWMYVGYWGMARSGVRKGEQESKPLQTKMEADAIMAQCSAVRAATPQNRTRLQTKSSYSNYAGQVYGSYPNYLDIRRWTTDSGRLLNQADEDNGRPVCNIGQTTAQELFGSIDPVGEFITIKNSRFQVVGLLSFKGRSGSHDYDDVIIVPYMVYQRKIAGTERSSSLLVAAQHGVDPSIAEEQVRILLREMHNIREGQPDDFRIYARSESAQASEASSDSFAWLLGMIAGVSLLVGGVGIMNIMLVSVTERTREIGLRMAIGAQGTDIMMQFLIEAMMLCIMGGVVGVFTGWGASYLLTTQKGYETEVSWWIVTMALGFASATGVFFGFYPAWQASRLDPIEALRYE
jgi:putative ABC transport system permease protein